MEDGNSAAERIRDRNESRRESEHEGLANKALDDLVDRLMDGQMYPPTSYRYGGNATLKMVLIDSDAAEVADMLVDFHLTGDRDRLTSQLERMTRDYLTDTHWHDRRITEMVEEEKENAQSDDPYEERKMNDEAAK